LLFTLQTPKFAAWAVLGEGCSSARGPIQDPGASNLCAHFPLNRKCLIQMRFVLPPTEEISVDRDGYPRGVATFFEGIASISERLPLHWYVGKRRKEEHGWIGCVGSE